MGCFLAVADSIGNGMKPCERIDIVIVGGGFGGMNVALALDSRLKRWLKA